MSKKQRILLYTLIVVFALVFVTSGAVLLREYLMRERDSETFEELADLILLPETSEDIIYDYSMSDTFDDFQVSISPSTKPIVHKRDLSLLTARNNDCVGWLYIEGSKVNYPVMLTPSEPEKYIDLSFDLKYSAYGVPFMDYRCTPDCDNVVIYGHNMNDGSMFATVRHYLKKEYYLEHPYLEFETIDGCKTYEVFAIVAIKSTDPWYSILDFDNHDNYLNAVDRMISNSLYDTGVAPEYGKQIITLSTCYGAERNDRLVLLAVEE